MPGPDDFQGLRGGAFLLVVQDRCDLDTVHELVDLHPEYVTDRGAFG